MKRSWVFVLFLLLVFSIASFAQLDIVIDAEKDAFYNTLTGPDDGYLYIPPEAFNDNGPMPVDEQDLSAYFWAAWDETYFYCYEEVVDDVVNLNHATHWQNDCLELKFDPDPYFEATEGVFAVRLSALDSADAASEDVWSGVDNLHWDNADINNPDLPYIEDPANYARRLTDDGYVLELRIYWDCIAHSDGRAVEVGVDNIFGLAIMNHDNDGTQRDGSIEWAAVLTDLVYTNPQNHGTVVFLEDNKLQFIAKNAITGTELTDPDPSIYIPPATGVVDQGAHVVATYRLEQNYPNPFNPFTSIQYSIPRESKVNLVVYDLLGKEIEALVDEVKPPGTFIAKFNGANLNSGVYFYKLHYDNQMITRKMMLLR